MESGNSHQGWTTHFTSLLQPLRTTSANDKELLNSGIGVRLSPRLEVNAAFFIRPIAIAC
jgi:hypothetical protein